MGVSLYALIPAIVALQVSRMLNLFGMDREGFGRYLLWPITATTLLLTKAISEGLVLGLSLGFSLTVFVAMLRRCASRFSWERERIQSWLDP